MKIEIGSILQDRYEIVAPIGSGGMSRVYKAVCHKLNRFVAIKVLKEEFSNDDSFVYKFKLEAQAAAGLNHPNIVSVYDVIDEDNLHYIVMEYVEGITLKEYIKNKKVLDIKEAVKIAIEIANGIKAAHDANLIHRDIKPQNIMVGKDFSIKVSDFGIAKAVSENTISSIALASVHYMSPEQAKGSACDKRTDIYSLGIVMYEMITGRLPFEGDITVSIALAHLEEKMPKLSEINNKVSEELEDIVNTCTRKNKERRYFDITDLIKDLEKILTNNSYEVTASLSYTKVISPKELNQINENRAKKEKRNVNKLDEDNKKDERFASLVGIFIAIGIFLFTLVFLTLKFDLINFLSINKKNNEISNISLNTPIDVPNLKNLKFEDAKEKLESLGLDIVIIKREESEEVREDYIINQKPKYREKLNIGEVVEVIVSSGIDKIDLDKFNLINSRKDLAIQILQSNGFFVEQILENSDLILESHIIKYEPLVAKKGDIIKLYISKGKEDGFVLPDLVSYDIDEVRMYLEENGLSVGVIKEEISDEFKKNTVISQSILPGTKILSGTKINFVISKGKDEDNYRYIASIDKSYNVSELIGPAGIGSSATIMIRLRQNYNGEDIYTTLMEEREIFSDIIIPIRYKSIEGIYGVNKGYVEIVETTTNQVLKTYEIEFFKVD